MLEDNGLVERHNDRVWQQRRFRFKIVSNLADVRGDFWSLVTSESLCRMATYARNSAETVQQFSIDRKAVKTPVLPLADLEGW